MMSYSDKIMTEEIPTCICGEKMIFALDNRVRTLWECAKCDRLLLRRQDFSWQTWYVPEAKLRGSWRLE